MTFVVSERRAAMALVPAAPEHDLGPEVCLGPATVGLSEFLAIAKQVGGGVLYLQARPFEPEKDGERSDETPDHLLSHTGELGQLVVAFAANGVVHFWEHRTAWYQEWLQLLEDQQPRSWRRGRDVGDLDDVDGEEQLSEEEQAQMAAELADTFLADPQFRAAKGSGARRRYAHLAVPPDTPRWVGWDAARKACDRADEAASHLYEQLGRDLDGLAAELLASSDYQEARSAAARKQVAERFLVPRADGYSPPAVIRDELYARAQQLAKARGSAKLF
jgi:hypothetical protein